MGNRLILGLFAGVALAAALTACGESDETQESGNASTPAASTAAAATSAATSAAAAATTAATQAAAPAPQALQVKAGDFFFDAKDITVRPGPVTVTVSNSAERRDHTWVVKKKDGSGDLIKSPEVKAGQSATVEFTVSEEGTYEVYCSLPGHASRGQTGTLTVTRS